MKLSQRKHILRYLIDGNRITRKKSVDLFGCYNLPARLLEIREMNIPVRDRRINPEQGGMSPKESWIDPADLSQNQRDKIHEFLYPKLP